MGCGLSSEAASSVSGPGNPEEALETALRNGDMAALEMALETPINVNKIMKDEEGNECTPLHLAARVGAVQPVSSLLRAGANAKAVDGQGKSALHYAALNDHPGVITELVKGGADIDLPCKEGTTALMCAINKDCTDAIHTLIQEGASVNAKDDGDFEAPLITAAKADNVMAVRMLIMSDANPMDLMVPISTGESIDFLTWVTRNRYTMVEEMINEKYGGKKEDAPDDVDANEENQVNDLEAINNKINEESSPTKDDKEEDGTPREAGDGAEDEGKTDEAGDGEAEANEEGGNDADGSEDKEEKEEGDEANTNGEEEANKEEDEGNGEAQNEGGAEEGAKEEGGEGDDGEEHKEEEGSGDGEGGGEEGNDKTDGENGGEDKEEEGGHEEGEEKAD